MPPSTGNKNDRIPGGQKCGQGTSLKEPLQIVNLQITVRLQNMSCLWEILAVAPYCFRADLYFSQEGSKHFVTAKKAAFNTLIECMIVQHQYPDKAKAGLIALMHDK